jgi:serine/threonine protein kinase
MAEKLKIYAGKKLGRWELIKSLGKGAVGSGGSGSVWEARDESGTGGAVKFLHPNLYSSKGYARFRDEVLIMSRNQDIPGVLPLLEYSVPEVATVDAPAWLITRLATPVPDILTPNAELRTVVEAVCSFARTLAALHARGISHRDIKPYNLFFDTGKWYIGDFGLVDYPGKDQITTTGEKVGPAYYVAPEMIRDSKNADGRLADVYSLAKTLWVLASGQRHPLPGEHRLDVPALLVSSYVSISRARMLDVLIESATRHEPSARITMKDFANELENWLNPADPTSASDDLSDLPKLIRAVTGPSLDRKIRRENLIQSARAILSSMRPFFETVNSNIEKAGLRGSSTWAASNSTNQLILEMASPEERMNSNELFWSTGEAFVADAGDPPAHFWCGAAIELSDTGFVNLMVGFAARAPGEPYPRRLALEHEKFLIDGSSQQHAIAKLQSFINDNTKNAILNFLKIFDSHA